MIRQLGAAGAAVLAMAAFTPAHAGVSFGSATAVTNASAYTDYGQARYGQGYGTDQDSTTDVNVGLVDAIASASASTYQKHGPGVDKADAMEESTGVFFDATNGIYDITGNTTASTYATGETAQAYSEGQSVRYVFTVDTASVIDLEYVLSETYSDPYSYIQLYLGAPDISSQVFNNYLTANTSGDLSFNLAAGTYELILYVQEGDYVGPADGASAMGSHTELLGFNITSAAPEPGTWALMTLGVGLAGAALRRRRTAGAFAA
jgi:hypothetical protein